MSTKTEIANLALKHCGIEQEIANLDTETGQEAETCRRFYDVAVDSTLRMFPWPFATKYVALAEVAAVAGDEWDDEWEKQYQYPSDCVRILKFLSGIRTDNRQSAVSFELGNGASGTVIWTDEHDAKIKYTSRVSDPARYNAQFAMALSFMLASYIAPGLTGGDPNGLGKQALGQLAIHLRLAQGSAGNEVQPDEDPESEFQRSRL